MRVALSVDALSTELTGIGRYCWELATGLPKRREVDEIRFFRGAERIKAAATLVAEQPERRGRLRRGSRLFRKVLKALDKPWAADVVHGPNYMLPDWADTGIITVHDLSVFRYPQTHPAERIIAFEKHFRRSVDRARIIITDSETVRREVIEFTGFSDSRVAAVPLGVADRFRPMSIENRAATLERYRLPSTGYGLSISALEPRKRIDRLIKAWQNLPPTVRGGCPLVIAGAAGWRNDALHRQIADASAEGWLILLPFVPEIALPAIYSGAKIFVFPSQYEGFGLPPLEAMASGLPTLVANSSCLPEVTGGAAMLVDPDNLEDFTMRIAEAIKNDEWRARAIEAGRERASLFSWERCVTETLDVYRRSLD